MLAVMSTQQVNFANKRGGITFHFGSFHRLYTLQEMSRWKINSNHCRYSV
uniref:Uncharacterized protein n=1 Tax=Anguilla anguilla TaxID=7936 RepID=A0A0E9WC85_ANGAN